MSYDPVMFQIEDRGYSRGVGTLLLPDGGQLAVSHEEGALELSNVLARLTFGCWEALRVG